MPYRKLYHINAYAICGKLALQMALTIFNIDMQYNLQIRLVYKALNPIPPHLTAIEIVTVCQCCIMELIQIPVMPCGCGGEMERGGLLTWLEWLVGSCAIICGGALTAEIWLKRIRLEDRIEVSEKGRSLVNISGISVQQPSQMPKYQDGLFQCTAKL